ncbi:type III PLP-dependent enzyme [Actinomadura logoneensis]|uniref:Type III PLP-dependent enzyme n=1 Tax=Actinomadura logoneensis TaxID=2293572 RepID=A0A372JPD6_9ACTN|nr:type III PLP-dependent enzyme [Actinomadura logoneensis]RFU41883.1 type III PLP-dependent enzyme [Actinomadura logoneensis]
MPREYQVQGVPVSDLARRYGTPFFVYDGQVLHDRFHGLRRRLHSAVEIFYSLKANPNVSVCALLRSFGARAEISSLVELRTARRAGVAPEDIIFLGPGKSRQELAACLDEGVFAIVCESFPELALVDELARDRGVRAPVALRINPSFAVKRSGLAMGGKPRQFGIDEEQVFAEAGLAGRFPGVEVIGVHVYMGTRILEEDVVVENTTRILELAERVAAHLAVPLRMVDVGGGLGVDYFSGETGLDPAVLAGKLDPVIAGFTARHPGTRLIMEVGRYLTAESGTYVVAVRYVKTSMGERFAVADGGTNHHMAAVGIGSFVKRNFPMAVLNRLDEPATEDWNITGPLCTPNDTLGKKVPLPPVRAGDLIGVLRSGAYGPTASPVLFLSHGYPAEVLVHEGRPHLIRERDLPEDLMARQRLYDPAEPDPAARNATDIVP